MKTEPAKSTNEAEIRGLIEARAKAVREKDVDAFISEFAPDVVMFNLAPPLQIKGTDKQGLADWFSGYQGAMGCEIRDLSIAADDTVAFCHYLYRITGTMTNGNAEDMWVRATLCFRKISGKWLITHEHDSEPFDMQTFKALLDLKP